MDGLSEPIDVGAVNSTDLSTPRAPMDLGSVPTATVGHIADFSGVTGSSYHTSTGYGDQFGRFNIASSMPTPISTYGPIAAFAPLMLVQPSAALAAYSSIGTLNSTYTCLSGSCGAVGTYKWGVGLAAEAINSKILAGSKLGQAVWNSISVAVGEIPGK
ncbi:MAG: hypothetical protein GXP16_01760 [Gammaproteobacteria bacterium]|nr:hypothetical protein [Gammaproteobacteria bacterium]